jgi:hypothetical protein
VALLFWSCLQSKNIAARPEGCAVLFLRQLGRLFHGLSGRYVLVSHYLTN